MSEGPGPRSTFSLALAVAVIAAIVGGVFTLAPTIYSYFQERKQITYSVTGSGILQAEKHKQIFIVDVENSGSTVAKNVIVSAEVDGATYRDVSSDVPVGVDVRESSAAETLLWRLTELNPGERAKFSFLAETDKGFGTVTVQVRATSFSTKEVVFQDTVQVRKDPVTALLEERPLVFFLGATVFLGAYLAFGLYSLRRLRARRSILGGLDVVDDRRRVLGYIAGMFLKEEVRLDFSRTKTFVEASDKIYLYWFSGALEKDTAVKVLICLLCLKDRINHRSVEVIKDHLRRLTGAMVDENGIPKILDLSDLPNRFEEIYSDHLNLQPTGKK